MSERVTIKSIARDLNISHMTVSRALSGSPHVREETRNAILKRAAELGYVRSAAASTMRGDRTRIAGLLLPNLVNEFYARYADCLAQHCNAAGLQLIIHLTSDQPEHEHSAIKKLREVQAGTVIMVSAPGSLAVDKKDLGDMQIIQLIRTRDLPSPVSTATVEDHRAIVEALEHLVKSGHRNIGYIGGDLSLPSGHKRHSAFVAGMRNLGVALSPELIKTGQPSFSAGYECARKLVEEESATAILCGGFEISSGALNGLLEAGSNLPETISFIGYGDPSFYKYLSGGISTISIPVELLAARSAELIHSPMSNADSKNGNCSVEAEFIARRSSGRQVI